MKWQKIERDRERERERREREREKEKRKGLPKETGKVEEGRGEVRKVGSFKSIGGS